MTEQNTHSLLQQIDNPSQMKELSVAELTMLADELREFIVQSVSQSGGHFSSGLGTVELTVALHHIFNTPDDRLVWDVGHQSYPHKILTGRREQMASIRTKDGLSGFPRREESPYDTFGVGHSSTSVGAALGMAIAAKHQNIDRRAVAIIGDGALTAGMAFEALNHAGDLDANLLVILNDNDMSISPNVGGMSNYLAKLLSGKMYSSMRESSKKVLGKMPSVWELARRTEEHVKGMVVPGTLFEELGFNYIGPIDGHDMDTLVKTLSNLHKLPGPQFLHIVTKKGKGYTPAEENPIDYHAVSKFDPKVGVIKAASPTPTAPTYTQVFGQWLCDMAKADDKLVAITPAMREGSGLVEFSKQFPERYFDVGIAEQHAVTVAAGMACDGLKPIVAIYSTFLQRAYDQLIHDVALQNLPILFAIDRAGVVGPDGATHAGSFDISYLRCIPNMTVMAPSDENECRQMLSTGFNLNSPSAVRYPRGTGPGEKVSTNLSILKVGKGEICRKGKSLAILSFGSILSEGKAVAEKLNATIANMRFIKPLDEDLLLKLASEHDVLITLEDNAVMGGAGSAVNEFLLKQQCQNRVLNLGLPDIFMEHASREQILDDAGLSTSGILRAIEDFLDTEELAKHVTLA